MRIATYNVEWFANLFDKNDKLLLNDGWSARHNITRARQIEAIAKVLAALDPDVILIVEAPNSGRRQSSVRALEGFAGAFDLRICKALEGFANDTQQELTLMYDPARVSLRHDPIGDPNNQHATDEAPRFDGELKLDLDVDGIEEAIRFSKPPLEAELRVKQADAKPVRLIGVHVKSKAPHGARNAREIVRISIDNRRKQMAQCLWIRKRVERHLDAGEPVIVLGDLNDGPGLDEYEHLFGHSGVEVVLGCNGREERKLFDPHAFEAMKPRAIHRPASSRFYIHDQERYLNALLDYIMVSPDLRPKARRWQIWHPFDTPKCFDDPELREALLVASDHFPVTLDIDL